MLANFPVRSSSYSRLITVSAMPTDTSKEMQNRTRLARLGRGRWAWILLLHLLLANDCFKRHQRSKPDIDRDRAKPVAAENFSALLHGPQLRDLIRMEAELVGAPSQVDEPLQDAQNALRNRKLGGPEQHDSPARLQTRRNSRKMASIWSCVKCSITPTFQIPSSNSFRKGKEKMSPQIRTSMTG